MSVAVGLLLVLAAQGVSSTPGKQSDVLTAVWNNLAYQYLEKEEHNPECRGCAKMRQLLERQIPVTNLTDIRLEMTKQQLLRKLGLTAPPNIVRRLDSFPLPIVEGSVFKKRKERNILKKQIERVVVIASDLSCYLDSNSIKLKLKFDMPEQIKHGNMLNARIWVYDEWSWQSNKSGLLTSKTCGEKVRGNPIYLQTSNPKGSWMKEDITWALKGRASCYRFKLAWSTSGHTGIQCPSFNEIAKKPFMIADLAMNNAIDISRDKRNVNCIEGITDCCREKLYLSFEAIGWGDWIHRPKGYDAYYCKGTCANAAAISLSAKPYHNVIKKLYLQNGNTVNITPCCTPTRLSPVQLIYTDQNGNIIQKIIEDLVVESCGCM